MPMQGAMTRISNIVASCLPGPGKNKREKFGPFVALVVGVLSVAGAVVGFDIPLADLKYLAYGVVAVCAWLIRHWEPSDVF